MNDQLQKLLSDIQEKTDNKFSGFSAIIEDIGDGVTELFDEVYLTQGEVEGIKKVIESIDKTNYQEKIEELAQKIAEIKVIKGEKGDKGDKGKNGKDGRDGIDGLNGSDGRDGIDGKDGKDGSPDTPVQISDKLNTLTKVLDWKVLKDFDSLVNQNDLKSAVETLENQTRFLIQSNRTPDLSGYTPTSRTITINGTTQDLSSNRSWTIPTYTFSTGLTNSGGTVTSNISTGISGGQSIYGGTASGNNLTIYSTSHATKGKILFGTSAYDEVNNRLGIGITTPSAKLEIRGSSDFWGLQAGNGTVGTLFQVYGGNAGFVGFNGSNYNSLDIRSGIGTQIFLSTNGGTGIGTTSPTAKLHLGAGTASANTAPLKFTSGTNLTTAEAGAMEYNGSSLFFTRSGTLRAGLLMTDFASPYNTYSQSAKGATTFTTGANNQLIGFEAGKAATSMSDSVFIGHQSGNTTNSDRVAALGPYAGTATAVLYGGVYIGYAAGYNSTNLSGSVLIGQAAGNASGTLQEAVFLGTTAGQFASGATYTIGLGYQAGFGASSASNSVFLGATAGHNSIGAAYTIGIGNNAGRNAKGSIESIYLGKNTGYNSTGTGITGDYNIFIGSTVGQNFTSGSKNVLIGYNLNGQSATASGQLSIQNAIFGTGNTGTGTTVSTGKIGIYTASPTCALDVTGGIATSRTAVTAPAATDGNIFSGTYTPTRSAEVNMDANVTMSQAQYMRVGNTVTVSGQFTADPTSVATTTSFEITLPVASNIGTIDDVSGTAFCGNIAGMGGAITGVVANDTASIFWVSSDITSQTWSYTFTYQVI